MPRRIRPRFPKEWLVPEVPKLWVSWAHANEKLTREQVYWVSTAGRDGRPHAAPVWGVWRKNRFYFETDPKSVKGRNLLANPLVVVHVQDGLDTVIVEGAAARETDAALLGTLKRSYSTKYDYRPDWSDPSKQAVFGVSPRIAHAWKAPRMHRTLVNFLF